MAAKEIRIPDLEGAADVGVVEVYVSAGDAVEVETPLISLESDKAVMDVPSPAAGTILELAVSEGDTVNAGDLVAMLEEAGGSESPAETAPTAEEAPAPPPPAETPAAEGTGESEAAAAASAPVAAAPVAAATCEFLGQSTPCAKR